jgi:transposase-like protein
MATARKENRSAPTPRATIDKHLTGQRESGLSIAAYCRKHSLSPWTFYGWRKRRGLTSSVAQRPDRCMTFTELPASAGISAPFEIVFPGGVRLRVNAGFDHEDLSTLLAIMGRREVC